MALAYPSPTRVFHDLLGRPVRLANPPDSGGYPAGCRGDSVTLRSPGNTPLGSTNGLVAQTRWGNPPGHVPGVLPVMTDGRTLGCIPGNSLNKWLRQQVPSVCVMHSFRHSMRDRLRAVGCPSGFVRTATGFKPVWERKTTL